MFSWKLAWRYAFSRSNRHRSAMVVIMVGIAVGMMAIIIMLSLMNSLQSELLDQVKSVESFHIQVTFPPDQVPQSSSDEIAMELGQIAHVSHVFPFVNTQVLIQNHLADQSTTARLRIIDSRIWEEGNPFSDRASFLSGTKAEGSQIVVGSSLAISLGMRQGGTVDMTVLASGKAVVLAPMTIPVTHVGTFRTGLAEFDSSTVMIDFSALSSSISPKRVLYGLYLDSRYIDRSGSIISAIQERYPQADVKSWQEVNSAFYSALTLEKVLMYLFLFFMFIILGVNMKNASSRLLHVKQRELAILRAVGAEKKLAAQVFLGQTFMVTVLGETLGILGGVLVGTHISSVFSWMNSLQFLFTKRDNLLLSYPFTTQVRALEIAVIAVSVLILSLVFTYAGCRRMLSREPMEMLYHD